MSSQHLGRYNIRTMQAAASMMENEPTVSKNNDLEWREFFGNVQNEIDCLSTLSNTRPILEDYKRVEE